MVEPRVAAEEEAITEVQDRLRGANIWTVIGASGVATMIE